MMKVNRHWWFLSLTLIVLLLLVQFWSAREVERRTFELRSLMSDTRTITIQLTQRIGYGGLIYNFKNLILRPAEKHYYVDALSDAKKITDLLAELEDNAAAAGIVFSLDITRAMVNAYTTRLDDVQRLHSQGYDAAAIDRVVRFDDVFVIQEIDQLIDAISQAVRAQVNRIQRDGKLLSWSSIGGTVVLSTLVMALLFNQNNKRRYLDAVQQMNRELRISNTGLTSANSALEQFAGIVSHDLRSPLRHIDHFNNRVIEDCAMPEEVVQHAAVITDVVVRMDRIIASLLEFTQTGFTRPVLAQVNVKELVNAVVLELSPAIELAGATVNLTVNGCVHADAELFKRVLHNVLSNSLKYVHAERPPQIDVVAIASGDYINFSISDNGIGVDPRFAERIFEPCQRLHDSQSQYEGSGIGLSLVKVIIEAHGGTIRLDTDYIAGTRIVFTLDAAHPVKLMKAA